MGRLVSVDARQWMAKREERGAEIVDMDAALVRSTVGFSISSNDVISDLCVECTEFMGSAVRNAAEAVDVLDRRELDDDPHLMTALKKYVEDTGEALKQVDDRLKKRSSSLEDMFPDLPADAKDTATWRDLIGRRAVIAHKILTLDASRVRDEADRDFRSLLSLLRNINFVPALTDCQNGRLFAVQLRGTEIKRLPPIAPGSDATTELGSSLILVCEDVNFGMVTFRLARSPENRLLVASSVAGTFNISLHRLSQPDVPN